MCLFYTLKNKLFMLDIITRLELTAPALFNKREDVMGVGWHVVAICW